VIVFEQGRWNGTFFRHDGEMMKVEGRRINRRKVEEMEEIASAFWSR
jgi:hypothetical protein